MNVQDDAPSLRGGRVSTDAGTSSGQLNQHLSHQAAIPAAVEILPVFYQVDIMIDDEEQHKIDQARQDALRQMNEAARLMYQYASMLPIGADRTKAFDCYENIRTAWIDA